MFEALSSWTTEVDGWQFIMILFTFVAVALAGYGTGIARGTVIVDERLEDLGIKASKSERLIEIYEPEHDQKVLEIKWDDEYIEMTPHYEGFEVR